MYPVADAPFFFFLRADSASSDFKCGLKSSRFLGIPHAFSAKVELLDLAS